VLVERALTNGNQAVKIVLPLMLNPQQQQQQQSSLLVPSKLG
jgi:hypothetical protein